MKEQYDLKSILKFIIIVVLIACIFYIITILISNKKIETKQSEQKAIIQYENIIIGRMFDQKNEEYYVFLKDKDDQYINYYETYINNYKQKENSLKIYYVDLQSAFNKKYIGKENNWQKENFMIKTTTLLKIRKSEIIETYQGYNQISEKLQQIAG